MSYHPPFCRSPISGDFCAGCSRSSTSSKSQPSATDSDALRLGSPKPSAEAAKSLITNPGSPTVLSVEATTPDVSSTEIRRRVGAGESIDGLVPSSVADHIRRHRLYVPTPVAAVL